MATRRVVPEEFPVLSDPVSPPQSPSVRPPSSRVSLSKSQFRTLMDRIQDLENSRRTRHATGGLASVLNPRHATGGPVSVLNPRHATGGPVSVLNPRHATGGPVSVLNPRHNTGGPVSVLNPRHATGGLASVLNPFPGHGTSSSAKVTHGEADKVKANPPSIFDPPADIRLWILEVDDYFTLRRIFDPKAQATVACSYLGDTLRRRTQRLRLAGDVEPFSTWPKLQSWLLANYGLPDAGLEADLAMDKVQMRHKETVQSFINRFETIIADLEWNESAVTAAFRRKLNTDISKTIHFLRPTGWPKTFADFKQVAQQAENHIRIGMRNHEDRLAEPPPKRVRFDLPKSLNERRQDEREA
ncbi:hypothetical protein MMC24_001983, partial [Lignoscripta atroalba]|nr:hypothetical protein [Lignoscripta atroalba]